ncbi:MAG: Asp-tRNA(Asn)/Glu-tRNA(Gln) amidotransferase subunit GatA [Candidatus Omnitrophica bacterium]|nr:Asp-tRNA(Asn)/Glu-tRNA(Gln) amidotransferase subunit GatA [Candidatus Omnitrophota bacterium]
MSPSPPNRLTITQIAQAYAQGRLAPQDVLDALSEEIAVREGEIHAYINGAAMGSDPSGTLRRRQRGLTPEQGQEESLGPLRGVPVAIKDNICVEGEEITCASKILKGFISPYHATVIEKLLAAGALIYGRTNMDEFAFGPSCETSCYGPTKNPRDLGRVPGGSSGGSAAAVAAHTAIAALGSDTGGSIRQPASFCGVVGVKPTYGRVSRYGLIAFASSLDQIGPITKDVRDAAVLLRVIAGHDPKDSTSADVPVPDYAGFLDRDIRGMKIGLPKEYFAAGASSQVMETMAYARTQLARLGAELVEISLPHTAYVVNAYYIIAPSEASSNLARFDGVRFGFRDESAKTLLQMYEDSRGRGFGAEVKRRIILGTYSLSSGYYDAYYLRAMKVRTKIKEDFDKAFQKVDALLTPTAPTAAFRLGEKVEDPLQMYLSDVYTISANLAGIPAISLPGGITPEGLPIGIQFLAKPFDEGNLFRLAHAFEQSTDFHRRLGNVAS